MNLPISITWDTFGNIFIAEKPGTVMLMRAWVGVPTVVVLDITGQVSSVRSERRGWLDSFVYYWVVLPRRGVILLHWRDIFAAEAGCDGAWVRLLHWRDIFGGVNGLDTSSLGPGP